MVMTMPGSSGRLGSPASCTFRPMWCASPGMEERPAARLPLAIGSARIHVVVGDLKEAVGAVAAQGHTGLERGQHGVLRAEHNFRSEERRVGKECRSRW